MFSKPFPPVCSRDAQCRGEIGGVWRDDRLLTAQATTLIPLGEAGASAYPAVLWFAGESLTKWSYAHLDASTSSYSAADQVPGLRVAPRPGASGLFGRAGTGDEDVDEPSGALLPIRAGGHVGDADQRP